MRSSRARRVAAAIAAALAVVGAAPAGATTAEAPEQLGRWSAPFVEPTIDGKATDATCVDDPHPQHDGRNLDCKPAAGTMAVLGGDHVLYWDALEDMEDVELSVIGEFGAVSVNDQSRLLTLGPPPSWREPSPVDSGASGTPHPLTPLASTETYNDGALFCASTTFLGDGRVLAVGGTAYYHDPAIISKYGVSELEGLAVTRVFDPRTSRWTRVGDLHRGRWYPSAVPMADGRVFIASGVTRLVKPVYPDRPVTDSGRNVVVTETFDPTSGQWSENPRTADRSLPLYPRMHLLPGGRIYFNAAGQVFNPNGFAYDEALWNLAAVYDPSTQSWHDLGVPGLGTAAPGFRGSTFSIMLPLRPDASGHYGKAEFLTAGGILGVSPGSYFAVTDSRIDTVDTDTMALTSRATGPLHQPRWYGTGVLTPTGEVIAFSGASADEVVGPGTAIPVTVPELFDPATGTWRELAGAKEKRTYHNTAALLPDGRILVGGHAPIGTLYATGRTLVPGVTSPQETRNPTFEIYSPPYLFRGDRPAITSATREARPGDTLTVTVDVDAADIDSVVLMRRTAITHLVDGGQRSVQLPVVRRAGHTLTLRLPDDPAVVPPGPYLLFANRPSSHGLIPSVGADVVVQPARHRPTAPPPVTAPGDAAPTTTTPAGVDLGAAGAVPVDAHIAFHEISEVNGHAGSGHDDRTPTRQAMPWIVAAALAVALLGSSIRPRLVRSRHERVPDLPQPRLQVLPRRPRDPGGSGG